MLLLYASAIFLSAFLLFVSEPMFARMLLPLLGGSPSVWNTAMVFYQGALLAGYAYAHGLRRVGLRWRLVHLGIMALAAGFFLPLRLASSQAPPAGASPILWLLATMAITIGPPFLLASTTGPLLQRWFAHTDHRRAADPYFLYAISNAGSLLGLLAYPFVVEPAITLAQQSMLWSVGYGALLLLVALCAFLSYRTTANVPAQTRTDVGTTAVSWRQRLHWVVLAFVPSSLMLGVTTHLTMDIIAIPLFWVLPLALYLLTFILAFARRPLLPFGFLLRLFFFTVLGVLILLESHAEGPIGLLIALHLSVLFAAGMVCHSLLAASRPPVARLTEFYLWVAAGGALGGVFNGLVAPMWFHSVAEYPIVLVIACLLIPPTAPRAAPAGASPPRPSGLRDVLIGLIYVGVLAALILGVKATGHAWTRVQFLPLLAVVCVPLYALRFRPVRFGLVVAGLMVLGPMALGQSGDQVYVERSFFGIHRVAEQHMPDGAVRQLRHGTTVHGLQWVDPRRAAEPLGYYHRLGPVGQIFAAVGEPPRTITVGIAGLGTGGLTAYARPEQRWTYYEIDPTVLRIASNPAWFSFLARSAAPPRISLGDARLNLAADTSRYDLLILDAYTSDAMPVHLLTREAFRIYRERLSPHGVLVAHISNRYFDLIPTLGALAADADLVCRIRNDRERSREEIDAGLFPSCFGVMARREEDLGELTSDPRWQPPKRGARVWTDDYASVIGALR